jgi:hypothetical protein
MMRYAHLARGDLREAVDLLSGGKTPAVRPEDPRTERSEQVGILVMINRYATCDADDFDRPAMPAWTRKLLMAKLFRFAWVAELADASVSKWPSGRPLIVG